MFRRILWILFATRIYRTLAGRKPAYSRSRGFNRGWGGSRWGSGRWGSGQGTFGTWRGGGLFGPGGLFGGARRRRWF